MAKKTYIVAYDAANSTNHDYKPLYEALQEYGTWAKVTESTWVIKTDDSAATTRDRLAALLPDGSRLLVASSGNAGAWRNVICRNEWLKKHL